MRLVAGLCNFTYIVGHCLDEKWMHIICRPGAINILLSSVVTAENKSLRL